MPVNTTVIADKAKAILGTTNVSAVENMAELKNGPKNIYAGLNTREKVNIAMMQMKSRLDREEVAITDFHFNRNNMSSPDLSHVSHATILHKK